MNSLVAALEAFVARDDAWHAGMRVIISPDFPILRACGRAVHEQNDDALRRCFELLQKPMVPDRLYNAFTTHSKFHRHDLLIGAQNETLINTDRLYWLILAVVTSARVAVHLRQQHAVPDRKIVQSVVEAGIRNSNDQIPDALISSAVRCLAKAGYGPTALLSWLGELLHLSRPPSTRVPVACVTEGEVGVITGLYLSSWETPPSLPSEVVPELKAALTPTRSDLLDALAGAVPTPLTRSIAWRVVWPPEMMSGHLAGPSLQGGAAVGLQLLNDGKRYHSGVLILAEVCGSRLCPVGYEYHKLRAAVDSYHRGRTTHDGSEERLSVQKVLISIDSDCDMSPADERGLPWERLRTVEEAIEAVIIANRTSDDSRYQIARSTRRVVAIPPPMADGYLIETGDGPRRFGADSRTDYIAEVEFKALNRFTEPYVLHYRAQAPGSLLEADCSPEEDNLFVDDLAYESYLDLKKFFQFRFRPCASAKYRLHAKVYDGFGPGRRNIHCHFTEYASHDVLIFELDLRAYASGRHMGYAISDSPEDAPRLSVWRVQDPELLPSGTRQNIDNKAQIRHSHQKRESLCDRFCVMARNSPSVPASVADVGLWRWEVDSIRFGAVLWIDWERTVVELIEPIQMRQR